MKRFSSFFLYSAYILTKEEEKLLKKMKLLKTLPKEVAEIFI